MAAERISDAKHATLLKGLSDIVGGSAAQWKDEMVNSGGNDSKVTVQQRYVLQTPYESEDAANKALVELNKIAGDKSFTRSSATKEGTKTYYIQIDPEKLRDPEVAGKIQDHMDQRALSVLNGKDQGGSNTNWDARSDSQGERVYIDLRTGSTDKEAIDKKVKELNGTHPSTPEIFSHTQINGAYYIATSPQRLFNEGGLEKLEGKSPKPAQPEASAGQQGTNSGQGAPTGGEPEPEGWFDKNKFGLMAGIGGLLLGLLMGGDLLIVALLALLAGGVANVFADSSNSTANGLFSGSKVTLASLDKDKDGKHTGQELQPLDKNTDGKLDAKELSALPEAERKQLLEQYNNKKSDDGQNTPFIQEEDGKIVNLNLNLPKAPAAAPAPAK